MAMNHAIYDCLLIELITVIDTRITKCETSRNCHEYTRTVPSPIPYMTHEDKSCMLISNFSH